MTAKQQSQSIAGSAMVELAIVLTSFFWLVLTPFQLCDAIHYRERISNLAQESASTAFRECSPKINNFIALKSCLAPIAKSAQDIAAQQFPGAQLSVVINMFQAGASPEDEPTGSSWGFGQCGYLNNSCPAKIRGKAFREIFNRRHDSENPSVLHDQKFLTISEVHLTPAFSFPSLLQLSGVNEFYEFGVY